MKLMRQLLLCCMVLGTVSGIALAQKDDVVTKHNPRGTPWLGVMTQDLNDRIVKKEKLKNNEGAFVINVLDDSPADSAGIKNHDIIIEFNGKKIEDANDLSNAVKDAAPGEKVTCVLLRAGQQQTVFVVVGKKKAVHPHAFRMPMPEFSYRFFARQPMLGLRVMEMNEQLAEYFGAPDNDGVLVEEVSKISPAAKAGFKAGDVILRVGKRSVDNMEDIRHELRKHDEGDKVEFEVLRKGAKNILSVEIETSRMNHFSDDATFPMDMYQSDPNTSDDGESKFMFNRIKPNLENLRLNLERMKQEMQRGETEAEINKIIRTIPGENESMIL